MRSSRGCVSCREEQEKLCQQCSEEQMFCQLYNEEQMFCQLYNEEQKKLCQLSRRAAEVVSAIAKSRSCVSCREEQ